MMAATKAILLATEDDKIARAKKVTINMNKKRKNNDGA